MSTEIFVDGICELDDEAVQTYFSRFGTRIINYESHRRRPTNCCCFAVIRLISHHIVDAILHQRPHTINSYPVFVKRLLPASVCSFSERLLPVTSLFVYNRITKELDEEKLMNYFQTFGQIVRVERDPSHRRLLVEFDDYDAIDCIFLSKDQLPKYVEIHKNLLPRAQAMIEYHGTCRRKERAARAERKAKKRHSKINSQLDERYQDLLQKTIEHLASCKAQLRSTENDYTILQMEYATLKEKHEQLNQRLQKQKTATYTCPSCSEHEMTVDRLQNTVSRLNQRLALLPKPESVHSPQHQQYMLSRQLNNEAPREHEVSDNCMAQSRLLKSGLHDTSLKEMPALPPVVRSGKQPNRTIYQYESVQDDEQ